VESFISKKLPFFRLLDHTIVFLDGSLGAGYRLQGIDISCKTSEDINSSCQKIESFLSSLEEGLKLQIFYRMGHDASTLIKLHKDLSGEENSNYQPVLEAQMNFLENKVQGKNFFFPEIYLFVRSQPLNLPKRRFFDKSKTFEGFPEKEFGLHRDRFFIKLKQIHSSLESCGLGPKPLRSEEWFSLCFSYFNLERSEDIGISQLRPGSDPFSPSLSAQLGLTNLSVAKDFLKIGNLYFRAVSLSILPEGETYSSMIESLTKLPFHFWISQTIHSLNQRKETQKLEVLRRIANSMASGSHNVSDIESESKLLSIEDLLKDVMTGSEKIISSDLNVIFWANSREELEERTEEILRAFRSMGQSEGLVETFALEDVFFKSAPSVCEGLRLKKMKTSNLSHLMPLFSSWMGDASPSVLLVNREGAPFSIDPFSEALPNWNGLVFGGSGSGKSFTISQLMLQFCGHKIKPKIVWIDNGASSEKLIEVLDGEFLDLHLESNVALNMFDLDPGTTRPSSTKIKLILGCLELILKEEDKPGLPKRDKGLLEEAIFKCYENTQGQTPILSDLREILLSHPIQEMNKYADILFSWTGKTAFGKMLDAQSNVKLTKDLVSIEIKGLENYRDLKDIMLLLLTSHIKTEAASDLSRPYLLIVDEAQRLFKGSPMGREFAIDCFRVFRKFNAGIWCISQNYKDFLSDSELSDSLMPNTTFVFILRQRKIDWEDFKSTFDFNEAQVEAIKSLEIVKGKYSEFFFMQDESQAVLRLEPEPLSYWISTTDGNEKSKIQKLKEKNPKMPLVEILKILSKGTYEA